jgi:hypothetical protein
MIADKPLVLYVKGLPRDGLVQITSLDPFLRNVSFNIPGNNNLELITQADQAQSIIAVLSTLNSATINRPDLIVNCMSDPDILWPQLENLQRFIDSLQHKSSHLQIINHPQNVKKTGRDTIYKICKNMSGMIVPKTIKLNPRSREAFIEKIKEENFSLPILIREAGTHSGTKIVKLDKFDKENITALDSMPMDGRAFYVTEFFDFKNNDNLYQKLRLFFINGHYYPRHLIISDHWNIHSRSREILMLKSKELMQKEADFLNGGFEKMLSNIQKDLMQISEALCLDFFGIDAGIDKKGNIIVFEINPSMEAIIQDTSSFSYLDIHIHKIKAAFKAMLEERLKNTKI